MRRDPFLLTAVLALTCGCVNPSDAPQGDSPRAEESASAAPEPTLTEGERASLTNLHRQTVEQFASRPMFGGQRLIIRDPVEDVITPPSEAEIARHSAQRSPRELANQMGKAGRPPMEVHYTFKDLLTHIPVALRDGTYRVKDAQLVGLSVHPRPMVYESDKVPSMKEVVAIPTRELNAFEQRGLVSLKRGEPMRLERDGKDARLMAPIFAGKKCTSCHEQANQLLGAFSYTLELAPKTGPGDAPVLP